MSMLNDSNPSVDALLAGFGNLSPEEKTIFLGKLAEGAEIKQKPRKRTFDELCKVWQGDGRTAEEVIKDIYESRTFDRERSSLR